MGLALSPPPEIIAHELEYLVKEYKLKTNDLDQL